jgi:glyoxylase-like metal-dependent hydrolase (beta-lactamase superfamily II)
MGESGVTVRMKRFALGPFETNCYVVYAEDGAAGRPAWIVDAGFEPGEMIAFAREGSMAVERVVLTHAHADHIAGLDEVREAFPGAEVLIHGAEADWLGDPSKNLSAELGAALRWEPATGTIADGETLELGGVAFEVLHTPGNSPGGVSLYAASLGVVLVGDTLFRGSVGRMDFPTSDGDALMRSIREKLYALPDGTRVFPGHGEATTIGEEKRANPFVRG